MTASPCVNQLPPRCGHVSMATRQRCGAGSVPLSEKRRLEGQRAEPGGAGGDARLRGRASWSSAASDGRLGGCHGETQPPFKARIAPELRSSSYAAAGGPLGVGTLEVGFLLLFQSLSHPSVSILLTGFSPARPCGAPCSGL